MDEPKKDLEGDVQQYNVNSKLKNTALNWGYNIAFVVGVIGTVDLVSFIVTGNSLRDYAGLETPEQYNGIIHMAEVVCVAGFIAERYRQK